jgi:endo-1,4-beta-xylanase
LKAAAGDRFKIGVDLGQRVLEQPDDVALVLQHLQILTPEDCMKPSGIHPAEARGIFEVADRFERLLVPTSSCPHHPGSA